MVLFLDSQAEMTEWSQMNSLQGVSKYYIIDDKNSTGMSFIFPNSLFG